MYSKQPTAQDAGSAGVVHPTYLRMLSKYINTNKGLIMIQESNYLVKSSKLECSRDVARRSTFGRLSRFRSQKECWVG